MHECAQAHPSLLALVADCPVAWFGRVNNHRHIAGYDTSGVKDEQSESIRARLHSACRQDFLWMSAFSAPGKRCIDR